jgi:hypothetical protein
MLSAHETLGAVLIGVCALVALWGGIAYFRPGASGGLLAHLLTLSQTLLVAQVGLGLLLLSDDRRAPDDLHYVYGSLALAAVLVPWFYAPSEGPRRLLWFSGATLLGGALATRAYMTGS